ncbi:DUF1707 domain-containing protein [Amycolatopsis sp. NPDC098790]|uniref:DUF1707 SHOCT-like domain-containing protein n=1 Tax=Amycolatopsis sp. NPDC098790 TaxID=3363939 RepID=UPI003821EE36
MGMHEAGLRVSDVDREHVIGLLEAAAGRGLLDLEEFASRADAALRATVRAELNRVLLDLPGLVHHGKPVPGERLELREAGSTAIRRSGRWTVPQNLVLRPRVRTADVDFTTARIDHREIGITLHGRSAHVRLRLPRGATVDASGLRTPKGRTARVRDRSAFAGAGGAPHFVLTGWSRDSMVTLLP